MLTTRIRRPASEAGFTLVEMIAAMAVLTILVAAFAELLSTTITRSGRLQEQSTLQTEARAGIDVLASDLRQALCNGTTTPITTASPTQLTFYSPDRLSPYHLRQVSYQLTGTTFQRALSTSTNTGGPPWTIPALGSWSTVFASVTSTNPFSYYDATNTATTDPTKVTRVDVSITLAPSATTGNDGATTYTATVDLRTPTC
jgi:prepilin-type N-terminal cleavage/methylation domain-containing protein